MLGADLLSNYVIGRNAVEALNREAMLSKFLLPEIPVGDTYPSWDGEILVYSSEESRNKRMKKDIIGKVPVQVKGNKVDVFSKRERKYSIEVVDLQNYLIEAGAIFFVVEMTDINDVIKTKIFFAEILITDIQSILEGKEGQKTITHTFQELPKERLYSICRHFLYHRKEQGFKIVNYDEEIEYDEYIFTIIGNKESDLDYYLFESGTYVYGVNKEKGKKIPISRIKAESKIEQIDYKIGTKDKVYYDKAFREKTRKEIRVRFGNSYTILFLDNKKVDIKFKESGSIENRIKDCEFFLEIAQNKKIYLNNVEFELNLDDDSTQEVLDSIPNHITNLKNILKVFNYLGVNPKEDFNDFKDYSSQIQFLLDVFIKCNVDANKITDKQFQYVNVGNYKFLLSKGVSKNNKSFFNFFDYTELVKKFRIIVSPNQNIENSVEHSPYILLKPEDLYGVDNLNVESIKKSLINADYKNPIALNLSNEFLLNTLNFLDQTNGDEKKEILTMVSEVFEYIYNETNDVIYFINKMQAIYRKRRFTEKELSKIIEMKTINNDNAIITCAFDILLDNRHEFNYRFDKLSEKERKSITEYPINNLVK